MVPSADAGARPNAQSGVALVLTLIFAILLYILVAELVVTGRMVRLTGENDALLGRMRSQMDFTQAQVEEMLLDDLAAQSAQNEAGGEGGMGGLGSAMAGAAGASGGAAGAAGAGGEGEGTSEASATCDGSQDQWYQPQGFADGDLTTYVWVEDENRKFNILALWSPDEEFARLSRERFVRLLDAIRVDTDFDISLSDAERIARDLDDWVRRPGSDQIPRPKLKTDDDRARELTLPLHLDELLMLPSVTEEMFFDKVLDGMVLPGLESVLTVWTSLQTDPGNPEKLARLRAQNPGAQNPGQNPGGTGEGSPPAGQPGAGANDPNAPPPQPIGEGIRININTAPRAVLRALFPQDRIPDLVIDAILRFRNEVDESQEGEAPADTSQFGDIRLGEEQKRKVFQEVSDLENITEFANLPDPELKAEFQLALTTRSDVFSIHLASMFRRNDENRVFVLRRARSIVVRQDNGSDGYLLPLVLQEERRGLRVMAVDNPIHYLDLGFVYNEIDQFAQEERAWNPFLVDFYLPKHQREQFYQPEKR